MAPTIRRFTLALVFLIAGLLTISLSPAWAQTLPVPGNVNGNLPLKAADSYTVTVPVDGDVTISVSTGSDLEAQVEFWDTNRKTMIAETIVENDTESFTVPHLGPGATYYITGYAYWGSGGYALSATEVQPPYAKSSTPNDTPKRATAMGIGTPVKPITKAGLVGYSTRSYNITDTVDYYKVTPNADGDMTISVTTDSNLEAYVVFWDADGKTLITETYCEPSSTASFTVPHLGPGATYYVSVLAYNGYGSYQLSDSLVRPKEKSQKEPDGSFAQAHPLVLNKTTTGLVGYSTTSYTTVDSADYFSVPGSPGTLTVTVATEPTLEAQVQVWDGNGNQLASFYTPSGSGQTSVALQSGGSYYVSVTAYDGYGGYTLTNTFH